MRLPNKDIILTKYESRDKWLHGRHKAVGASDVSTLFGMNGFSNVVELFWVKTRLLPGTPHNINSVSGEIQEPNIAKYFSHYDPSNPTDEVLVKNIETNTKLRKIHRFKRNVMMTEIPLSCTLDYISPSEKCVVECKNMLNFVVSRYEDGILPGHLLQVQAQMLVTGLRKAVLCYLVDGRFYREWTFEANQSIQDRIKEEVVAFWARVEAGRKIWNDPTLTESQKMVMIHDNDIEPEITTAAGDTLTDFLNLRAKEIISEAKIMVTPEIRGFLDNYKINRELEGTYEKEKSKFGNQIRSLMIAHSVSEITTLDGKTIASYRANAKGSFTLKVN